jgi:hypothetical protein
MARIAFVTAAFLALVSANPLCTGPGRDEGCGCGPCPTDYTYTPSTVTSTNLGTLSNFVPPASCTGLTAEISYYEYATPTSTDTTDFYPSTYGRQTMVTISTNVLGAGAAWVALHTSLQADPRTIPLLSLPTAAPFQPTTIPPNDCFPSNFFSNIGLVPWALTTDAPKQYFSPAPACPTGWAMVNSSVTISTTTVTSSTSTGFQPWATASYSTLGSAATSVSLITLTRETLFSIPIITVRSIPATTSIITGTTVITETRAICCPQGWDTSVYEGGEFDGLCYTGSALHPFTAVSYFDDKNPGQLSSGPLTGTVYKPSELAIQIRWQTTDVPPVTATSTSGGATHTGGTSTNGTSTNGTHTNGTTGVNTNDGVSTTVWATGLSTALYIVSVLIIAVA